MCQECASDDRKQCVVLMVAKDDLLIINLSGRGDKDVDTVARRLAMLGD